MSYSLDVRTITDVDTRDDNYCECDYDKDVTPLYQAIEEKAWFATHKFLHSGLWPDFSVADSMSPQEQSCTWVTRYEARRNGTKKIRWCQLPIHAAMIFGAPFKVVKKLIEHFPTGVRCTDDRKMLPLHLAFQYGAQDAIIAMLIEAFPEAIHCKGYKDRTPFEFAQISPNPDRAFILQTVQTALARKKSSWETKQADQCLQEVYHIKQALENKSQKVNDLEQKISEIRGREEMIRKQLMTTQQALDRLELDKKKQKCFLKKYQLKEKTEAEKRVAEELTSKLSFVEMTTEDLLKKEQDTEKELKETIQKLENLKKPTSSQRIGALA